MIKSKQPYGIETAQLTEASIDKIDAFQIKGLRQILGFKHTHWDRSPTNQQMWKLPRRLSTRITRAQEQKEITPFGAYKGSENLKEEIKDAEQNGREQQNTEEYTENRWLYADIYDEMVKRVLPQTQREKTQKQTQRNSQADGIRKITQKTQRKWTWKS